VGARGRCCGKAASSDSRWKRHLRSRADSQPAADSLGCFTPGRRARWQRHLPRLALCPVLHICHPDGVSASGVADNGGQEIRFILVILSKLPSFPNCNPYVQKMCIPDQPCRPCALTRRRRSVGAARPVSVAGRRLWLAGAQARTQGRLELKWRGS
jgi:hypothetical protein